jgi:hypothetical protein
VAQLFPWALGSLFVASYDSQGYGGGILSRLHTKPRHCRKYDDKINLHVDVISATWKVSLRVGSSVKSQLVQEALSEPVL